MTESQTKPLPTPKPLQTQCPTCQITVLWTDEFPHRPFCSKRCQLVDFGEWAKENYRVPAAENDDFADPEE